MALSGSHRPAPDSDTQIITQLPQGRSYCRAFTYLYSQSSCFPTCTYNTLLTKTTRNTGAKTQEEAYEYQLILQTYLEMIFISP